jgi:PII-like signaling protein
MIPSQASLLCVYLNANERGRRGSLYQEVVERARAVNLAGASVFLVDLSYGSHRRLHDARSEYTGFDIPVAIEMVDGSEKIDELLSELRSIVAEGLATVAPIRVLHYGHSDHQRQPSPAPRAVGSQSVSSTSSISSIPPRSEPPMIIEGEAQRLIVYVGSSDTWRGRNLAMAIVERCRELGLAGATASLGVMGFGKNSRIHRAHFLGLSEDVPERVEIVEQPDRIAALLPALDQMVKGGLIIVENVRVIRYLHDPKVK